MQHRHRPHLLTFLLAALLVFGTASAGAQTVAVPPTAGANPGTPAGKSADKPAGRPDRAIERIRTEDAGSRIDELRVGGETQSITVQPAANVPAYEVRPMDASRAGSGSAADTGSTGSRFWNILKF
jgi:hypothetical protein